MSPTRAAPKEVGVAANWEAVSKPAYFSAGYCSLVPKSQASSSASKATPVVLSPSTSRSSQVE